VRNASHFSVSVPSTDADLRRPNARSSLAGPVRTGFSRGVVADGEDEIERRRDPAPRTHPSSCCASLGGQLQVPEQLERNGCTLPFGLLPAL
jgi:hypothetical protein